MSEIRPNPVVFLDANILASAMKRHLILSLADAELLYPRWSQKVLFETGHAHARIVSGQEGRDGAGEAARLITALQAAYPEACPANNAPKPHGVGPLPDGDDRHVIEAAWACESDFILTENIKDFPRKTLEPLKLYARRTSEFLGSELSKRPMVTKAALMVTGERLMLSPSRFALALRRAQLGGVARKLGLI